MGVIERRNHLKKLYSYTGSVLEAKEYSPANDEEHAFDGFYPLEALVQGIKWPQGVDPTNREKYLSDTDFESLFGMTKSSFQQIDKYKRIELKKKHLLF